MDDFLHTVGVDEAGRGPLAGPVAVCAVLWHSSAPPVEVLDGIRDSKKLTPRGREAWRKRAEEMVPEYLRYSIQFVGAPAVDSVGIVKALAVAAARAVSELNSVHPIRHVYADYGLPVPGEYAATHMVKGDERHPLIALSSVFAKTERDRLMCSYADSFPLYGFERHKGYGTREHREAIVAHGVTPLHRKTFLRGIC